MPDISVGHAANTESRAEDTTKKGKSAKKSKVDESATEDTSKLGKEERIEDMPDIRPAPRSALQTLHRTAPSEKKRAVRTRSIAK